MFGFDPSSRNEYLLASEIRLWQKQRRAAGKTF
jgi:hypothetical protein